MIYQTNVNIYVDIAVFDRRYRYYRLNEFIRQKKKKNTIKIRTEKALVKTNDNKYFYALISRVRIWTLILVFWSTYR